MRKGEFTEQELEEAKQFMISIVKALEDEQDTLITYYMGLELSGYNMDLEEYTEKLMQVSKEQVVEIANKIQVNTIYFLRN